MAQISAPAAAAVRIPTYTTTLNYLIRFYPRYTSFWVQNYAAQNRFLAPTSGQDGLLTSAAQLINAFNVDTVYASVLNMNLSKEPEILTIPPRETGVFSMLTLDIWGNVFNTGIPTDRPGTYAPGAARLAGRTAARGDQGDGALPADRCGRSAPTGIPGRAPAM